MHALSVLETCLYVDDLGRAERFYSEVLGLAQVGKRDDRHVFFRCGRGMLLLFNPLTSRESLDKIPAHGYFGSGHMAFGVREAELPQWVARLEQHRVAVESVVDWPGGGRSVYFRDPSGNSLEFATPRIWELDERILPDESLA